MENNWIGNTIQLIAIGFIAYIITDFVKPFISKGALVEKEAGHEYDQAFHAHRSSGDDIHNAANKAYQETSPTNKNHGGYF